MLKKILTSFPGAKSAYHFLQAKFLLGRGREAFLRSLPRHAKILDVGCGNNSPRYTKQVLSNCHYTGLDIGDYNQIESHWADRYIITDPEGFAERILQFGSRFDAVISNHNLEHCNDREKVLEAMLGALNDGGKIYLAFPSEQTVLFPKREGSLNYYDDASHQGLPPDFSAVIRSIERSGCKVEFAAKQYKPVFLYLIGSINERKSREQRRTLRGTWAYYGFESVIHARKTKM
jgi:SAM-dependent methyltransferase